MHDVQILRFEIVFILNILKFPERFYRSGYFSGKGIFYITYVHLRFHVGFSRCVLFRFLAFPKYRTSRTEFYKICNSWFQFYYVCMFKFHIYEKSENNKSDYHNKASDNIFKIRKNEQTCIFSIAFNTSDSFINYSRTHLITTVKKVKLIKNLH